VEAHAYTPGLKVKKALKIERARRLTIPGKVLVKEGDTVDFSTVIAETLMPGDPHIVNVAAELGILSQDIDDYMTKKVGGEVSKGESIAVFKALFGLWKKFVYSPVDGTVENISPISGQVILREKPVPLSIDAYIPGRVVRILENEGAIIETNAAFIQGIFGIGGEVHGEVRVAVTDPSEKLADEVIEEDNKGKVIIGGSVVTKEALDKAIKVGVKGIVTGGIRDVDLQALLGYELGVAITGQEETGITLIVTEGFGEMAMNPRTLEILKEFEGYMACINGSTQIRAGVIRPEVIIPHGEGGKDVTDEELSSGMRPGTPIRIIRQPYFGKLGRVVSLPVELQTVEMESRVRVVEVELEDGRRVVVPRANVEIIEI